MSKGIISAPGSDWLRGETPVERCLACEAAAVAAQIGVVSSRGCRGRLAPRQLGLNRRNGRQPATFARGCFYPLKIITHCIIVAEVCAKPRPGLGCHPLGLASEATLHGRRQPITRLFAPKDRHTRNCGPSLENRSGTGIRVRSCWHRPVTPVGLG
jgi:hypothetical protein